MLLQTTVVLIVSAVSLGLASDILKFASVDHIDCKVNKDYCPHSVCRLSFITRELKSLTFFCDLTKKVDIVNQQVTLYYRYRAGYKKFLIDLNVDLCSYYTKELDSAVMNLIREQVKNYSTNLIHPCPFSGNLSLDALPLTPSLVNNLFVPAGEYKLVISTKLNKEKLIFVTIAFYVKVPGGRVIEDDAMG